MHNKRYESFFKPETRKSAKVFIDKDKVSLTQASDTRIQAYVRTSTSYKVNFYSESIASENFTADCSCSSAIKGSLCKHIYATLLVVEKKHPDFLDSKESISMRISESSKEQKTTISFKEKQNDYRKLQYQKQKLKLKQKKIEEKANVRKSERASFSKAVEEALAFFADNGFPMKDPLDEEDLKLAKKKLARVFHPDRGGTHEEAVLLHQYFDLLILQFGSE